MLPIQLFNRPRHDAGGLAGRRLGWPVEWEDLFGWVPDGGFRVDVRQEGDDLVFEAEVPGLTKEELDITVENNTLTITGEHKTETEESQEHYHIRERRSGRFTRSFQLPATADGEKVSADLAHGILTLRVPTREEARPRKIEVK